MSSNKPRDLPDSSDKRSLVQKDSEELDAVMVEAWLSASPLPDDYPGPDDIRQLERDMESILKAMLKWGKEHA